MNRFTHFLRSDRGSVAVEFSVLWPIAILGVISLADVASIFSEKFSLDQALRIGGEVALSDPGEQIVKQEFLNAYRGQEVEDHVTARRLLTCGVNDEVSAKCRNHAETRLYYEIAFSKEVSGIIMPAYQLSSQIKVQIR